MNKRLTRQKSIREKCLDCCADQPKEVRLCPIKDCPLWRYRLGYEIKDNPEKAKIVTKNEPKN